LQWYFVKYMKESNLSTFYLCKQRIKQKIN
jgi:hypothetical protein